MQQIQFWLQQPYPFEARWLKGLRNGLGAGAFITLFLFFFRPFGTEVAPGKELHYLAVCTGFGLVTLFITLLINGLCLLLPKIFDEEQWRVWKELAFNLFFISCIGLGNLLYANLLWNVPLNGRTFLLWQGLTFAVGIFPSVFGAFKTQLKYSRKYGAEAAHMHLPVDHPSLAAPITLSGENQNETLHLKPGQTAYLEAQDNYVQVYFLENGLVKRKMLRATLRKMEETLANWPQFVRCHRRFVVNFDLVEKVSGNAQGYRLHLTGLDETIPVSRNLHDIVRSRLNAVGEILKKDF